MIGGDIWTISNVGRRSHKEGQARQGDVKKRFHCPGMGGCDANMTGRFKQLDQALEQNDREK